MSQKAVTDALNDVSDSIPSPTEIAQTTGDSETAVMSQKAVTDALNDVSDSIPSPTEIAQTTGDSETAVMSQKAVTGLLSSEQAVTNAEEDTITVSKSSSMDSSLVNLDEFASDGDDLVYSPSIPLRSRIVKAQNCTVIIGEISDTGLVEISDTGKSIIIHAPTSYSAYDITGMILTYTIRKSSVYNALYKSDMTDGHIPKWDDKEKTFVDSETSLEIFRPNKVAQKGRYMYIGEGVFDGKSGVVIPTRDQYHGADNVEQEAYAIVFDHETKTLRLGSGCIKHSKNIYTDEGEIDYSNFDFGHSHYYGWNEDEAIATRADEITDGNIPKWDDNLKTFVDSGVSLGDINTALDSIIAIQNSLIGGESE